jgi:hypothetical protein
MVLNIAAAIHPNSILGKTIETKSLQYLGKTAFNIENGPLKRPHVSLLQIFVKNGTNLNIQLRKKNVLDEFANKIVHIYKNTLYNRSLKSKSNDYVSFGTHIARRYNKENQQETFRNECNKTLFEIQQNKLMTKQDFISEINIDDDIPPFLYDNNGGTIGQKYTHYSIKPEFYPNSIFAEGDFYTKN